MAAPKNWGYTRDRHFNDELLVSWADGDLTKILVREFIERLLRHSEDRATVAAYARACEDSSTPTEAGERDWLLAPPRGLVESCRALAEPDATRSPGSDPAREPASRPGASPLPISWRTAMGGTFVLVLTALILLWMLRNL